MTTTKKILTVIALSLLALSMSLSAFAADTGSFIQSPTANQAPELVEGGSDDHECDEPLIITAYADRDQLPEELRKDIEAVYDRIKGANNLTALCPALKTLANKKNIPTANLEVSDLFDVRDAHADAKGTYDIVLKAETLENFVGLLHYTDDKYELVENAKVTKKDGEYHLTFSTDGLSPFAIVVDTGAELPTPSNNSNLIIGILTIAVIAESAALIAIIVKAIVSKKFSR